ncbi:MAG: HXXEE domain-containing protein [Leptolyngbya sp. SIO1D8]|nr:HXXEE domain-containing protein [Leptolyngbya sp. SIO1D8]
MLSNQFAKVSLSYWILGITQVAHSTEETLAKLYLELNFMIEALHQHFPWFPLVEISSDVFAMLNYIIIALMLASVPVAEKGNRIGFIFMWSWAIIELLNGMFHIGTWVVLHTYFPGGISGPILFVLSILFIQKLQATSNQTVQEV